MSEQGASIHPGRFNIIASSNKTSQGVQPSHFSSIGGNHANARYHLIQDSIDQFIRQQYKQLVDTFVDDFIVQVSNVHSKATEHDLRQLFSSLGAIVSITPVLYPTGRPKGIWFIQFETVEDAVKATTFTNQLVQGHAVDVSPNSSSRTAEKALEQAKEQARQQFYYVTCTGFPFELEQDHEFISFFQTFGSIEHVDIVRYAVDESLVYIRYRSMDAVAAVVDIINDNQFTINGKTIRAYPGTYKPPSTQHRYDRNPFLHYQIANSELCLTYKDNTTSFPLPVHAKYTPVQFSNVPPVMASTGTGYGGNTLLAQPIKATSCGIIIGNVFDPRQQQLTVAEAENILMNVLYECSKYGRIRYNSLHPNGNLYLLVDSIQTASNILTRFHGRWMNLRKLTCVPIAESSLKNIHPAWF